MKKTNLFYPSFCHVNKTLIFLLQYHFKESMYKRKIFWKWKLLSFTTFFMVLGGDVSKNSLRIRALVYWPAGDTLLMHQEKILREILKKCKEQKWEESLKLYFVVKSAGNGLGDLQSWINGKSTLYADYQNISYFIKESLWYSFI